MKSIDFIKNYEIALATQDWNNVKPLIHEDATVIFSNGSIHEGKTNVKTAFEKNFSSIKGEKYTIKNVRWMHVSESIAVYLFDFYWEGFINDIFKTGAGQGSSVIIYENEKWVLLTEHLGPKL